jgi:hypothetical protein
MIDKFFISADNEYNKAVQLLRKTIPELFIRSERSYYIEGFIGKYGENNEQRIDYDEDYLAFNQAFFLKNLYKCFIALSFVKCNITIDNYEFVDIGSGAGAFSLAAKSLFRQPNLSLKMIDNCNKQLDLLKRVIGSVKAELIKGFFPVDFERVEGIRLASYWLCEQDDSCTLDETGRIKKNILGEAAIFIDYPNIIGKLIQKLDPTFEFIKWSLNFKIPVHTKTILDEPRIRIHGAAVFKK